MIPLGHEGIEKIRKGKQHLEVELAKHLNGHFKKYYAYSLRKMVYELIHEILRVGEGELNRFLHDPAERILDKIKWRQYLLFRGRAAGPVGHTWDGLHQFSMSSYLWSLEDCSDIIRLFGEINEEFPRFAEHLKGQRRLRPNPTFVQVGKPKTGSKPIKEGGWGENFGHRDRLEIGEDDQIRRGAPYVNIGPIVRGVEKYKFEPKSVIATIDRTFGLRPEGGDVSGTTTDSIYALRWAGGTAGVNPNILAAFQLLPMVTMVPQGHHAMVECAYPLSRHGYIDYHIGYYKTLVPLKATDRIKQDLEKVIAQYDSDMRNKHILVWGHGTQEEGVQMATQAEIDDFKRMARVLSAYGFCVAGGLNNVDEALNVARSFRAGLVAAELTRLKGQGAIGVSELERKFRQFGLR